MKCPAFLRATSLLALAAVSGTAAEAQAFEYRRPNLVGPYTDRRMTNPVNAMTLISGPGSSFTFGQRYDARTIEGGFEYGHTSLSADAPPATVDEAWNRFGIGFGLLPYLDAGAVFLNFQWAPAFDFSEVMVYVTQAFNLGDLELGVRVSFLLPDEALGWQFNPALLAVYRSGRTKVETGIFSGSGAGRLFLETELPNSQYIGLNIPVRVSWNATPSFYIAGDSGLYIPRFDQAERTSIPLGALAGYTVLSGGKLFDFSMAFRWDELLYLAPASGVDALQPGMFRFNFGVTMHKMAVAPPH